MRQPKNKRSATKAILARDPKDLPSELPRGGMIPDDLDPFADGILMKHQNEWIGDESPLKICEKGRRTGITFAEALDDTLIAALKRSEGGSNVFYIGDTKAKGREFIGYVAHFAKVVCGELGKIEEFMFDDEREDGTTKYISSYRVTFASGFRIEALSSNPANIRGLQGIVVIDEAAYHRNVREVVDAVNALLIWGGKVRIISTHNGLLNPFNELITEARAFKNNYKIHVYPFQTAIDNGLYERVCLVNGLEYTKEGEVEWEAKIRKSYGTRDAAMKQELDAIPADAEGSALSRVEIERVKEKGIPVIRWKLSDAFKGYSEDIRKSAQRDWCRHNLKKILDSLDPKRAHVFGSDFARTGDASVFLIFEIGQDTIRRCKLIFEMRNVPFDQQRDALAYCVKRMPRMAGGALDATGNGAYVAEALAMKFGESVVEVKLSTLWYQENSMAYIEAFADETLTLPADEDIIRDHQSLAYVNGIVKVPDDARYRGADGLDRHGDSAIAGMLAWFASRQNPASYGYKSAAAGKKERNSRDRRRRPGRSIVPQIRGTVSHGRFTQGSYIAAPGRLWCAGQEKRFGTATSLPNERRRSASHFRARSGWHYADNVEQNSQAGCRRRAA